MIQLRYLSDSQHLGSPPTLGVCYRGEPTALFLSARNQESHASRFEREAVVGEDCQRGSRWVRSITTAGSSSQNSARAS